MSKEEVFDNDLAIRKHIEQELGKEIPAKEKVIILGREELSTELNACYLNIISLLRKYCDVPENYYKIIALWIIGTYTHDSFETFPLLFINAAKGSGKSRLVKLIIALSKNGKIVLDLKEAPLFRTAKGSTLALDEFENLGSKENSTIRTLLNACYKKGSTVERLKKASANGEEKFVIESFDLYTAIVIANIWGMEEVLADRCLQVFLDKSDKKSITKLIEDFQSNFEVKHVKRTLESIQCSLCSVVTENNIAKGWNNYIISKYSTATLTTLYTYTTLTTLTTLDTEKPMYSGVVSFSDKVWEMIDKTEIDGRNLELLFPIFIIARAINQEIFEEILAVSATIIRDRKNEEFVESKDISLIDFVSGKSVLGNVWLSVNDLTKEFRQFVSSEEEETKWMNSKWFGRALKRNKLIADKRRKGRGIEVLLDVEKAKSKLKMFKEDVTEQPK